MADGDGGGICCRSSSHPAITNNTIMGNTASDGGGICCYHSSSPSITRNIITRNAADEGGGVCCFNSSYPTITNNTIAENTAIDGGGICCYFSCSMAVTNTILWNNNAPNGKEIWIGDILNPSTLSINYSDVEGGQSSVYVDTGCTLNWGLGMIDADPLFVDSVNGDFHLQPNSPCIDAGDPDPQYNDPDGTRNDMGAFYFDQSGPYPDLTITSLSFDPTSIDPNGTIMIDYTVENIGSLSCGSSSMIGFYLSRDEHIGSYDIFLCEDAVPDLNPGDSFSNVLTTIDIGDSPGNWYVLGHADWMNDIDESNETNNAYSAGILTINSLWSDVATISKSTGGTVTFDLRSSVAHERRHYFLLGSMSGTSPGTPLPGGNIIPLNRDNFTDLILKYYNYPVFTDFRGLFDLEGEATAVLNAQGPLQVQVGTIVHFAFTAEFPYDFQSNPVAVEVVP